MILVRPVVLDANVLINLIRLNKLDILKNIKGYKFFIPNHVTVEVHKRTQRLQIHKAFKEGWIQELEISDLSEIEFYIRYRSRFGQGESACMAVAESRGWIVASDDRSVQREVKKKFGAEKLMSTDILLKFL